MFDIGALEIAVIGLVALVVVGPKDLPRLLRSAGQFIRKIRQMASEFKMGVEELAAEADRAVDPFNDLRKAEGLKPGMSPEDVTNHIMGNRAREAAADSSADTAPAEKPAETEPRA